MKNDLDLETPWWNIKTGCNYVKNDNCGLDATTWAR